MTLTSIADIWIQRHLPGKHNQKEHAGGRAVQSRDDVEDESFRLCEHYESWSRSLTAAELIAMEIYVSGARRLNSALRRGRLGSEWDETVKGLDSGISRGSTPKDLVLYRGASSFRADLLIGTEFTDKGFVSTSLSLETARDFSGGDQGSVIRIRIPKGTKGAYLPATGFGVKVSTSFFSPAIQSFV